MRKKELPAIARRLLDIGRTAYTEKDFASAQQHLTLLLQLLDDEAMKGLPEAADLRTLADGFLTLASARPGEKLSTPHCKMSSVRRPSSWSLTGLRLARVHEATARVCSSALASAGS